MITKTCFPVRYTEIDSLGIVHHSKYPLWFEMGRIDFLKKAGLSSHKLHALGFLMPLTELKCEFKSPAKFGDAVTVITSLIYMSYVKIKFRYTVLNKATGIVLAKGITVHAWTNKKLEPINIEKAAPEVYRQLKQLVEPKETC